MDTANTDNNIRQAMAACSYYLESDIGRIIHYPNFSIVRYDGTCLRSDATEWIVFIGGKEADSPIFEKLRHAKEWAEKKVT